MHYLVRMIVEADNEQDAHDEALSGSPYNGHLVSTVETVQYS